MLLLIDLNLFYSAFIFEKSHQFLLRIEQFGNVFYINCITLFLIHVFALVKFFISLLRPLVKVLSLYYWRRWNPLIIWFPLRSWRWRREKSHWSLLRETLIRLRFWYVLIILSLIGFLYALVNFGFLNWLACWLVFILCFMRSLLIRKL